jgi:transcriptional regulator with XRE-family HTH domain
MGFATKVRLLLKRHKLTQSELAESLGTRQQVVSRWLEADKPPKAIYLLKLAKALQCSVEYLIDDLMEKPGGDGLSCEERYVLRVFRDSGLDSSEAARRIMGRITPEPMGPPKGKGEAPARS